MRSEILKWKQRAGRGALLLIWLTLAAGCRTAPPLARADLSGPGWRIQQGQAVWKPSASRPELAGDLLLATNANGNFFVQFTKEPFPLVTAERMDGQWQIEFGADKYFRQGRGDPPIRFVWFWLARALNDGSVSGDGHFQSVGADSWRLENKRTGETLEGRFFP